MAAGRTDALDTELIDELAKRLFDEDEARALVLAVGLPPAQLPVFKKPGVFWTQVVMALRAGAIDGDGVAVLAHRAHRQFRGNEIFARHGKGASQANGNPRAARSSSGPRRAPSHTAIVLDRTHAWQSLTSKSAKTDDNRAFIVHGTWQQDLDLFMQRIETYFRDPDHCERLHHVISISPQRDFSDGVTAEDWERAAIAATRSGQPPLEHALEGETLDRPVLLLLSADGPLRDLEQEQREGLLEFLSETLPGALQRASLAHPVRVVVPVEGSEALAEQLQETLYEAGPALNLEAPIRLELPDWMEVRQHVTLAFGRRRLRPSRQDVERCREHYQRLMGREPQPHLRQLADELHALIERLIFEAKQHTRR